MNKWKLSLVIIIAAIAVILLFNRVVQGRPYYLDSCSEAKARHITNIPKNSPYYRKALDRDNNGLACEG